MYWKNYEAGFTRQSWNQMCASAVGVKGGSATSILDVCCRCSGALPRFLSKTKALTCQLPGMCLPWEPPYLNWAQLHPKGHPNSRATDRNCWGLCCHYNSASSCAQSGFPSWEHSQPTLCILISGSTFPKELNQRLYSWPSSLLNKK